MKTMTLGILGGLGPMSGVYFCEMLTAHTHAECDQEHLNFILSSRAETPDRTAFILGCSSSDPVPVMKQEVKRLTAAGADLIVIPCNTAHHFYDAVIEEAKIPLLNIIHQTADFCRFRRMKTVGVLATEGTVASGAYETALAQAGITYLTCPPEDQAVITRMIYDEIKQGKEPDPGEFFRIADNLRRRGAETVILGCTELSLLKRSYGLGEEFTDSLEVLALSAIRLCGKAPVGFDPSLMQFVPTLEPQIHTKGNDYAVT